MNKYSSEPVLITIGIPTYQRQESLREILIQISSTKASVNCEVLVINNGALFNIVDEFILLKSAGYSTKYIQNQANCGGQENVIRIYENASGKYVWFLGDDDRLFKDSLTKVFSIVSSCDCDLVLFNANAKDHPQRTSLATGEYSIESLLGGCLPLRKLMFAPLQIIRRDRILKTLPIARLYLRCFCPQLLLITLGGIRSGYYLNDVIISCEELKSVAMNDRLSMVPVFLGIGFLPNPGQTLKIRRMLRKLITAEVRFYLNPFRMMAAIMIARISGPHPRVSDLIGASLRNYNFLVAILFSWVLMIVYCLPVSWLARILEFVYKKLLGKTPDFSRYYSCETKFRKNNIFSASSEFFVGQ